MARAAPSRSWSLRPPCSFPVFSPAPSPSHWPDVATGAVQQVGQPAPSGEVPRQWHARLTAQYACLYIGQEPADQEGLHRAGAEPRLWGAEMGYSGGLLSPRAPQERNLLWVPGGRCSACAPEPDRCLVTICLLSSPVLFN